MYYFEVEIQGKLLYSKWPPGEEIVVGDCRFIPGEEERGFTVHTEVEAKDENQASKEGKEKCIDAVHLLELCIDEEVYLDESQVRVRKKGDVWTGLKCYTTDVILAKDSPLTVEQLEEIKKAQNTLKGEKDPRKRESLMRAIHWQAFGRRETRSRIDRFIKFWIALEVLVEGRGEKVVYKVEKELRTLYPSCSRQRIKSLVKRIYGLRGDVVHSGEREPEGLEEKLKQLEAILEDLLRSRLGLNFKALTKRYLV